MFSAEDIALLKDISGDTLHFELTRQLLSIERKHRVMARRAGVFGELERAIERGFYEDEADATDLVVFTFGNGVPMSLRAARRIGQAHGWKVRVVDLRWLVPLNEAAIARHAGECRRILVVDEGRRSAGVGEGIITAIVEAGFGDKPLRRVVGADTFTPLAGAAFLVIPSDDEIVAAANALAG